MENTVERIQETKAPKSSSPVCAICKSKAKSISMDYFLCKACNHWGSTLPLDIENAEQPEEEYALDAFEYTRRKNSAKILQTLQKKYGPGKTLLEVGCADGLFLKIAEETNGYQVLGVEPNDKMAQGKPFHQNVLMGFFPEVFAKDSTKRFDIIALHDVFEHIPDVHKMIEQFKDYLAPGGTIVINLPVSSGVLFQISKWGYKFGIRYPFDRLWQKGFFTPHVHFFSKQSIQKLFAQHGCSTTAQTSMDFFNLKGIYDRLGIDPNMGRTRRIATLIGLYLFYPASKAFPDARAFFFTEK